MPRWILALAVCSGCTSISELSIIDQDLPENAWIALVGGEGSSVRTGLSRYVPGSLVSLEERPDVVHVLAFSDEEVQLHHPTEEDLASPVRLASTGDLALDAIWSRTYRLDEPAEPLDTAAPAITAHWVRPVSSCQSSELLSLVPFGPPEGFFGEPPTFGGQERSPYEIRLEEALSVGPDRVLAASRSHVFLFERGHGVIERPTHIRARNQLTPSDVWITALAVGPERDGHREVLIGTSGPENLQAPPAAGVISLSLGPEGLGEAQTSTITGRWVTMVSFLSGGDVVVGGEGDLLISRRVDGSWSRHPTGRSLLAHHVVLEAPLGLFIASSDGALFHGPSLDRLTEETLWVAGIQVTSSVMSVSASRGGPIWAATQWHGVLERSEAGGRFDAFAIEVPPKGARCAAASAEATFEVALTVHDLRAGDDGLVFVLPRDCHGLYAFRAEDRCARVIDVAGRFDRGVDDALRSLSYGDGRLTVSGLGVVYQLTD